MGHKSRRSGNPVTRFVVRCWTATERWDFDKADTFCWDVVEVSTGEVYMRFLGEIQQDYGCLPEYSGACCVKIDPDGRSVVVHEQDARGGDIESSSTRRLPISRHGHFETTVPYTDVVFDLRQFP